MQIFAGLLSLQVIPVAVLALCAGDASYRRHSRFGLRFALTVVIIMLPQAMILGPRLSERGATKLIAFGFLWGLMLIVPARFFLFHRAGPDPGAGDDPGSDDSPPGPRGPTSGRRLPDVDPARILIRDQRQPRAPSGDQLPTEPAGGTHRLSSSPPGPGR